MTISVIEPISRAIERTKSVLFSPFNLGKWCILGFCAFLASLGEGGGCNIPSGGGGGGPGGGGPSGPGFANWVQSNLPLIILGAVGVAVVILAIGAVLIWLSSRGKFMFVDGIVRNRAAVVEPWRTFRPLGNSLFVFSFAFGFAGLGILIVLVAIGALIAWPDIQAGRWGGSALTGVLIGGLMSVLAMLAMWIIGRLLDDFVFPTMYLRQVRVMEAWDIVFAEIIPGRIGTLVLFYLMKIVLGIAIAMIVMIGTLFTCCIGGLPYVSSVLFLPLLVFSRCYSLYFLEQFGPEWRFFTHDGWPPRCYRCGYDLRGNVTGVCPECGTPIPEGQPAESTPPTPRPPGGPLGV